MTARKTVLGLATLLGAGALAMSVQAATAGTNPSALVFDQQAKNKSIAIEYVYLPEKGYAAVYRSGEEGKPSGAPIGNVSLDAGDHRKINVTLNEQPKSGETLWISLYKDADGKPTFDPGEGDEAIWSKGQLPSSSAFVVR